TLLEHVLEGAGRMRELLSDLMEYMEIGSDLGRSTEPVDLNLVMEYVVKNLEVSIEECGAEVTFERMPVIDAHRSDLVPLFQNLISNALKYRSERPPRVHVSVEQADGELCFSVSDNGIGIAPEYHDRIFEVFKRLHGKKIPGT